MVTVRGSDLVVSKFGFSVYPCAPCFVAILFSSLFIEIPYLVVRNAIIQKFSTTAILSTSAFSAFSPDAYVCCDPTDEVSYGCEHLVSTRYGLEEVKFFFLWGSFCLLIMLRFHLVQAPVSAEFSVQFSCQYDFFLPYSL
ncbi:hypothetical protein H5410_036089 [Solanum commersonii]|uniref:Uncharacterized protein n=1 Tax=Solanum commersonii TaxID=4109 RepID=A0A9J5Y356_SOLCO|nr:hypothetical protein H5410_036089 [Solanum commersonii]